jgi:hypothetical protein
MRARLWRVAQRRAERMALDVVMAGLVPAIHVLLKCRKGVDARHKAGHDRVNFGSSAHIIRSGTGSMLA